MKRELILALVGVWLAAGGGGVGDRAMAQPQPVANPVVRRFPELSPAGFNDEVVGVGMWETRVLGEGLVPQKVFVAGTMRTSDGAFITVAKYNIAGGAPESVAFWPQPTSDPVTGGSRVAAKALVVPAVEPNTPPEEGRIFVTGTADGMDGTTDIVVLAYDFNLALRWMKTFDFGSPEQENEPGDETPIAITTSQTPDAANPGHSTNYDFVAVLGRVARPGLSPHAVTLAYCKMNGTQLMSPRYEIAMYGPVDICVGSPEDLCGVNMILITGQTSSGGPAAHPGQIMTQAYLLPSVNPCQGSSANGVVASGWPRYKNGTFGALSPEFIWATPARIKFLKGTVFVTGTTGIGFDQDPVPETHMLTFAHDACSGGFAWTDQWAVWESPNNAFVRGARAVDMDVVFGAEGFVAVTGSATSRIDGKTGMATMVYRASGSRWWIRGSLWDAGASNDDRPTAIRCIAAMDAGTGESAFNVYLAGKTLASGGYGYITLKYDGRDVQTAAYKPLSWQQNLPFYVGPGAGDDVPRGLAVEYKSALNQSGQTRRIWTTGNSWHVNSLDDWATQFIVEQLP